MTYSAAEIHTSQILVIEDSESCIQALKLALVQFSNLAFVKTGQQGIERARKQAPDLILLDVNLPDIDGWTTCKLLRSLSSLSSTPIIFITGCEDKAAEIRCWQSGGNDFVQKPVDIDTLNHRVSAHLVTRRQLVMANRLVKYDALTGVFNRYHYDKHLQEQLSYADRYDGDLSLLLIDIDYFKLFNDVYGHSYGDEVLKQVAGLLKQSVSRPLDAVFRYGGEEFVMVLPGTCAKGAQQVAERLMANITAANIPNESSPFEKLTVSIGLASLSFAKANEVSLFDCADALLYQAKHTGRNRLVGPHSMHDVSQNVSERQNHRSGIRKAGSWSA